MMGSDRSGKVPSKVMKPILTALSCFLLFGWLQASVPTPEMAMSVDFLKKDPRNWTPAFNQGNEMGIIMEFVPKGDNINEWKEMVAHQIAFTKFSVRAFVDVWKAGLMKAAPGSEVSEETAKDGSILVTYTALQADETSMRRFIKAGDGIYMLAYHVRPKLKDKKIFKLWQGILLEASLFPNPQKGNKSRSGEGKQQANYHNVLPACPAHRLINPRPELS